MAEIDLALAHDNVTGLVTLHRVHCPVVRRLAAAGYSVFNMFGCAKIPDDYPRHSCLDDADQ